MKSADIKRSFAGKKVTLMGLGLLGRGIGDAKFFAEAGADLIVTDLKTETELEPSIKQLKDFPNITYHLGGHRLQDFEKRDLIVRAPNAPLDSPFLAHARKQKIPVEMDSALFVKLSKTMTVGITGTRGKSTVTHLIYEMAKAAGKNPHLGGNEKDVATLALLPKVNDGDLVILELDSWQLQGFEEGKISPHVAIWTNFMPDHMNYYKNDVERYFQDKTAIARFQKNGDYFITAPDIKEKIEKKFGALKGTCITDVSLPKGLDIGLLGEHNRKNAAYAYAAARCLDIPDDVIKKTLKDFAGLPGRMEFLGEKNGIAFYNDSNSTTPEATIAALKTLSGKRPIVLIAGGSDKELDMKDLASEITKKTKWAIFFEGKATEKLKTFLPKKFHPVTVKNMETAFKTALAAAKLGDIILLSPGATSFGIFKNEYDRGEQFKECVRKLK